MSDFFEVPSFHNYLSPEYAEFLLKQSTPTGYLEGLCQVGPGGGLENEGSLSFLVELYEKTKQQFIAIMKQRIEDRQFIDLRTKACNQYNKTWGFGPKDKHYKTVIGLEDARGRIVVGPKNRDFHRKGGTSVAPIPDYLDGYHVTIFGPPDSAKMAINAMNSFHRKLPGEPKEVEILIGKNKDLFPIKWGADHEDSKTPIRSALIEGGVNLTHSIEGKLSFDDNISGKSYVLRSDRVSLPIKRIAGLALPCSFLFYKRNPIPLHLYEFALHFFRHWAQPQALAFYVPKLETEEEAAYLSAMIRTAEELILKRFSSYKIGSVRLMIVMENPRAVFRIHEIMDALYPYFAGASLGWHDFLGSTARLFKEDSQYRIPVKADPEIVIKHIKESHLLLADVVGSRGGIKIGGMYGILPVDADLKSPSFQAALKGFFKDVLTQLKRSLTGFWVAHPDFVRIGLAIVEAWKLREKDQGESLDRLIDALLSTEDAKQIKALAVARDVAGLNRDDPCYHRSLLVADLGSSSIIPHNDPEEVRYNVFQSLQYLADWLAGNGCVALPTTLEGHQVRVMDDLATAERSRWEVWHEVYHGRFSYEDLIKIAFEEMNFIRKNLKTPQKKVQVTWDQRTEKWYPIAFKLMLQLMTTKYPPEFATELLLPFTCEQVRQNPNPWRVIEDICPQKYLLEPFVERFVRYFEVCGCVRFAKEMALSPVFDLSKVAQIIQSFSIEEIKEAAFFHGDIGQSQTTLDAMASAEQALVQESRRSILQELVDLGGKYLEKFGFKFLISAKGRSAQDLLFALKERFERSLSQEIGEAKNALVSITEKRLAEHVGEKVKDDIDFIRSSAKVTGMAIALTEGSKIQSLNFGWSEKGVQPVDDFTQFELASLSKTLAAAFSIEFFRKKNISLDSSVQKLLAQYQSPFRLSSALDPLWVEAVTIRHLLNHTALSMHYVKGFPAHREMPSIVELLTSEKLSHGLNQFGYDSLQITKFPGSAFQYSGGGYLVLEHLIELIEKKKISQITRDFLDSLGLFDLSFEPSVSGRPRESRELHEAFGYDDQGSVIEGGRFHFPAFAAGARGTASSMLKFLNHLEKAYQTLSGSASLSHDTAVDMLFGRDLGSRAFMGCDMGLGVFVREAGPNRIAVHQGANEGFRALYVKCFAGPDSGKGFVILCNGDHAAVPPLADVARTLLGHLKIQGIDLTYGDVSGLGTKAVSAENKVNEHLMKRVFNCFLLDLPEEITQKGPLDALSSWNHAIGADIFKVSDQKFARAENLISSHEPVFDPELFGAQGKVMDSWETRRHNPFDRDFLELKLREPAFIHFVAFSTKFHDGNHPDFVRLLAKTSPQEEWVELVPKVKIEGHSLLKIQVPVTDGLSNRRFQYVRVEIFPDGGLSRLGLFSDLPQNLKKEFTFVEVAKSVRFSDPIPKTYKPLTIPFDTGLVPKSSAHLKPDFASAVMGGKVLRTSNEHYGPSKQVISPFPPIHMFDGLESKRSRSSGHHEEVEIQLGSNIKVGRVVVDFSYFVNNNPDFMSILCWVENRWVEIVPKNYVKPFAGLKKSWVIENPQMTDKILVKIYPDGGVHRVHVFEV